MEGMGGPSAGLHRAAHRRGQGTVHVKIKLVFCILATYACRYALLGLEQTAESCRLPDYPFPAKCVLVLGREKEGLPPEVRSGCHSGGVYFPHGDHFTGAPPRCDSLPKLLRPASLS